jgi:peptidoglycan hydrolase-like protein with peptidoglycan-binding domain
MRLTDVVPRARLGPPVVALVAAALLGLAAPARGAETPGTASASWHGRAIQDPRPRPEIPPAAWPDGWSAGAVGPGSGYLRPGGSDRVRDVQRRLVQLGYRPGPVDGLFGPRTRAAVRWFQYKHGLATRGRVNRSTLAVLHARSDHQPLRVEAPAGPPREQPVAAAPTPAPSQAHDGDGRTALAVSAGLLLLALALGVITGLRGPRVLRALERTRRATPVLGYAAGGADDREAAAAIAARCAIATWTLVEVVDDAPGPNGRLAGRRGLTHALDRIRQGAASGLVVARLRDVAPTIGDLAILIHWLQESNAFLAAADHELDTSTSEGRATARAIVELGAWERRSTGRFAPRAGTEGLTDEIVSMLERGVQPRALADALTLAGFGKRSRR